MRRNASNVMQAERKMCHTGWISDRLPAVRLFAAVWVSRSDALDPVANGDSEPSSPSEFTAPKSSKSDRRTDKPIMQHLNQAGVSFVHVRLESGPATLVAFLVCTDQWDEQCKGRIAQQLSLLVQLLHYGFVGSTASFLGQRGFNGMITVHGLGAPKIGSSNRQAHNACSEPCRCKDHGFRFIGKCNCAKRTYFVCGCVAHFRYEFVVSTKP